MVRGTASAADRTEQLRLATDLLHQALEREVADEARGFTRWQPPALTLALLAPPRQLRIDAEQVDRDLAGDDTAPQSLVVGEGAERLVVDPPD